MMPIFNFQFSIFKKKSQGEVGLTLIELLIALAIVALLILLLMIGQGLQLSRGEDARRKADLAKLKVAFEDYYNDHNCYPPPALLQRCYSSDLAPYVAKIPCDPRSKQPYPYYLDSTCQWYALYTTLGDLHDPVTPTLGCFPTCGVTGQSYNYIQTNGKLSPAQTAIIINGGGSSGGPTPTPTPAPTPSGSGTPGPSTSPSGSGSLACDPSGQCNIYADPAGSGCPVVYSDATLCQQACSNPANRCAQ